MERMIAAGLGIAVAAAVLLGVLLVRGAAIPELGFLQIPLLFVGAAVAAGGLYLFVRGERAPPLEAMIEPIQTGPRKPRTFSGLGPITGLRVFVHDLERARAYYRDAVGLTQTAHTPPVATFQCGQVSLVVEQVDPADPEAKASIGRFVGASFATEDARATYDALRARGVEWAAPPERQHWGGVMAHFRDPDGNVLTILQLPRG